MDKLWKYVIVSSAFVLAAMVLAAAYTSGSRNVGTIAVTGLGETEFSSDLIVIKGVVAVKSDDAAEGYKTLDAHRKRVAEFLAAKGVKSENISFAMPTTRENNEEYIDNNGHYATRFAGYIHRQGFTIESKDVDSTEMAARELPSLMAEGVMVSVAEPMYHYTQLESVKHDLIGAAAADARQRAEIIATNSGTNLGVLAQSRAGVFQITAATGDEEFSAGGSFNLSSREKKARVTVRAEYKIRNN
ncbi:MAG: SIMPL domain-containing protein [Alistipes sp.]|nr:SIMPL domain-containing protein [Alistipes sp.]MBR5131980.1 SIMPL domain-containing protein [Alistipes sp.]